MSGRYFHPSVLWGNWVMGSKMLIFLIIIFMCMSVLTVCMYVHHIHVWCPWSWTKEIVRLPELDLWLAVSHKVWVLGIVPGSPGRTARARDCWVISPPPQTFKTYQQPLLQVQLCRKPTPSVYSDHPKEHMCFTVSLMPFRGMGCFIVFFP